MASAYRSNSRFMPLSDEDDDTDFANFSLGNDSPRADNAHSRKNSETDTEGHLYAGHQSTAGMRAAQQQKSQLPQSQGSRGAFGDAMSNARDRSAPATQDTIQNIKAKSASLATFLKDKATQAGSTVADPEARQTTISKFKLWGQGAAEKVQNATAVGWQSAREMTAEGIKRFYGGPLEGICKQEHSQRPCPRTILVLCTALVTNGLYTEGVFKEDAPAELVHYLLGALQEGQGLVLPPAGTDPTVIASAIKQFLLTLPEPLFTYKGTATIIAAGREADLRRVPEALAELPAASLNALSVLLETWHRVAEQSSTNGMDAMALAVAVAPCLAWNPPPSASQGRKGYQTVGVPQDEGGSWRKGAAYAPETLATEFSEAGAMARSDLEPEDQSAIIAVLEYAITNFRGQGGDLDAPLYDFGSPTSQQLRTPSSTKSGPEETTKNPGNLEKEASGKTFTSQQEKPAQKLEHAPSAASDRSIPTIPPPSLI